MRNHKNRKIVDHKKKIRPCGAGFIEKFGPAGRVFDMENICADF